MKVILNCIFYVFIDLNVYFSIVGCIWITPIYAESITTLDRPVNVIQTCFKV